MLYSCPEVTFISGLRIVLQIFVFDSVVVALILFDPLNDSFSYSIAQLMEGNVQSVDGFSNE